MNCYSWNSPNSLSWRLSLKPESRYTAIGTNGIAGNRKLNMDDQTILRRALELESLEERSAFLDEACGDDALLRKKIEALLRDSENTLDDSPETPAIDRDYDIRRDLDDDTSFGFLSPSDEPDSLGRIGYYEIAEVLGQGGAGIVFKAHDPKLNRYVAVKVLAPQIATSPKARKRFLREAYATAAVTHPHVITIHAVDEHEQTPFLVMEYINGKTLDQKIREDGALGVKSILQIGLQIAQGLAAAHAQGLIHRDIKPANILLEDSIERVKITDFGLARTVDDIGVTRTGQICGTPRYMSPEQGEGHPLDHRSDLFSFGSVLYAMCTGSPPFGGTTTIAVMRRVCDDTPPAIGQLNPDIPPWLVQIIDKLLAKSPDDRFQSASEVADLFARHLPAIQHPSGADPTGNEATESKPRRPIVYLAAVLLVLIAGLAAMEFAGVTQLHLLFQRKSTVTDAEGTSITVPVAKRSPDSPPLAIAPFDAAQARTHQQACAIHLGVSAEWANSIGMKLMLIPPGTFETGKTGDDIFPKRHITVTRAFYLGATEVTVGQFRQFVKATGYKTEPERPGSLNPTRTKSLWHTPEYEGTDNYPVSTVTYADAEAFCKWLSKSQGARYRLPTEAQWELAARAGTNTKHWYASLSSESGAFAWAHGNSGDLPHPVGTKRANPYGLYDQYGNMWEWVADWHAPRKAGKDADPVGPAQTKWKVCVGGCYIDINRLCSSDGRMNVFPKWVASHLGFRVLLEVDSAGAQPAAVATDAPDRAAAAFLFARGSAVGVDDSHGRATKIRKTSELPEGPIRLQTVFVSKANDELIKKLCPLLERCGKLTHVNIEWPTGKFTQVSVEHLSRIKSLKMLRFQGVRPAGRFRFEVLAAIGGLQDLRFEDSKIGDEFVLAACKIPQLRKIGINACPVTDKPLQQLAKLKSLATLYLSSPKVTNAALESIGAVRTLKSLTLHSPHLTDAIWKPIAEMPNLTILDIGWHEGLPAMKGTGISALAQRRIEKLLLIGLGLDDGAVREITTLSHVRHLILRGSSLSDEQLQHFGRLKDLQKLNLSQTNVTEAGVAALKKALPNCQIWSP